MDQIVRCLKSLEVTPTILALRSRAEDIKQAEIDKALARLQHLSPQERAVVEGLAGSIVNKLLHGSLVTLKTESASGGGPMFIEAARRFFGLDEQPATDCADAAPPPAALDESESPESERHPAGKRPV